MARMQTFNVLGKMKKTYTLTMFLIIFVKAFEIFFSFFRTLFITNRRTGVIKMNITFLEGRLGLTPTKDQVTGLLERTFEFSKICLGMKIGQQINLIVINKQANSLYSLIADGQYRATSLGRST